MTVPVPGVALAPATQRKMFEGGLGSEGGVTGPAANTIVDPLALTSTIGATTVADGATPGGTTIVSASQGGLVVVVGFV